ncbi:MAG: co-chaperone GroES [Candidatus Fischerbacteria bacterium RBG_13_37_8]|uniref:Co-chaperonin GroES n=1 Tax=Candidatus Fischerbacteria bacterium RBG_13_37_8 TaxID=1817863 RepID=A0A1F5VPC9_9BACT|nr:MAG: co-chaperone GroES [Candidatus Fischerbacteria bacterium RBG_13_37_8]
MKIQPLQDRVVIQRLDEEEYQAGSIIIPDTAKEKPQKGKVIAIGNGKLLEDGTRCSIDIKVGEKVIFSKYAGTEFKMDDQEYLIIREEDILAIIE